MSDLKVKNIREVAIGEINELIGEINNDFYREFCFAGFNQLLDDISTLKSLRKTFNMPEKIDGIKNRVTIRDVSSVLCSITNDNDTVDDENDLVVFGKLNYLFGFEPIYLLLSSSIPFKEQIYKSGMTTLTNYFKDENIQIENLFELSDGFLNGEGKAPPVIGLLRFFNDFNNNYDYKLPMPNFFPTVDGNILLEWKKDNYDISLEVNLKTFESTYNILNFSHGIDFTITELDTVLNLTNNSKWELLNINLSKYFSSNIKEKPLLEKVSNVRNNFFILDELIMLSNQIKTEKIYEYLITNINQLKSKPLILTTVEVMKKRDDMLKFLKNNIQFSSADYIKNIYALLQSSSFITNIIDSKEPLIKVFDSKLSLALNNLIDIENKSEFPDTSCLIIFSEYYNTFINKNIPSPSEVRFVEKNRIYLEWSESEFSLPGKFRSVLVNIWVNSMKAKVCFGESDNPENLDLNLYMEKSWNKLNEVLLKEFKIEGLLNNNSIINLENKVNEISINIPQELKIIVQKELDYIKSLDKLSLYFNKNDLTELRRAKLFVGLEPIKTKYNSAETSSENKFYLTSIYLLLKSELDYLNENLSNKSIMVDEYQDLNGIEKSDNDIYIVNEYKNQPILKKILNINNLNIRNSLIDKYEQLIIISDDNENDNIEEMESRSDKIYFNKIIKFPFDISSELNKDIGKFYNEINNTHYGMLNVKTKIAEILASQNRNSNSNLPVICLVGSPGVGKTSLVHSICNALNRKLYKISLNDSPDIYSLLSGFSSTYKSSTNGRISQSFLDTGVNNPVILLDEIDKAIKSQSGDVSNGLLSVIDPTQNKNYYDSYFGFGIDLSKVFFICTANSLAEISPPLLDRMVVINVDGYSNNEKLNILKNHSIPKVFKNNGISNEELLFHDDILEFIILNYSSESGMRSLESIIDSLCKKFIFQKDVLGNNININFDNIDSLLENNSIIKENAHRNSVGYVNGLYVSDNGGGITKVESIITDGDGKICDLGLLGDMMKNSIQVIYNLLKSNDKNWNLPKDFFKNNNICVSLGGSRNVDGPSAGTAIVCSILSSVRNINIPNNIAMTGEIDLHGNVLPIGGCREKILGGKREGVNKFFFPIGNENDIKKLEDEIKNGIEIKLVKNISEILYELGLRR